MMSQVIRIYLEKTRELEMCKSEVHRCQIFSLYFFIIIVALAEITTVMGSEAVVQAAEQYGKSFISSEKISGVDLQDICYKVMKD